MKNYTEAVEHHCAGLDSVSLGICSICPVCQDNQGLDEDSLETGCTDGTVCDEGEFSTLSCESCGSNFAGDRYSAHGWTSEARKKSFPIGELCHLSVCTDCAQYHANGEIPESWEGTINA